MPYLAQPLAPLKLTNSYYTDRMAKRFTLPLLHILTWVLILFFPIYVLQRNEQLQMAFYYPYLIRISFLALLFYAHLFVFVPRYFARRAFVRYTFLSLVLAGVFVLAHNSIRELLHASAPHPAPLSRGQALMPPDFNLRIYTDYLLYILITGMAVSVWVTRRWFRDNLLYERQQSKLLEANLRNLQNQLNPHFLFNTLNNIYSLIAIDQSKAQESVHRLSGLLRYVLYENEGHFVPIDKELDFTRSYIDLMRLRLRKGMMLDIRIENHGYMGMVAPLMFITLIENAFKHSSPNAVGELYIQIHIDVHPLEGIRCLVANSKGGYTPSIDQDASGIGLENLKHRLLLLYPNKYSLSIEPTDTRFAVALSIQF